MHKTYQKMSKLVLQKELRQVTLILLFDIM